MRTARPGPFISCLSSTNSIRSKTAREPRIKDSWMNPAPDLEGGRRTLASGGLRLGEGAYIAPDVDIAADVVVGAAAVVLGDATETGPVTTIQPGVEIGANATVLAGVLISHGAQI